MRLEYLVICVVSLEILIIILFLNIIFFTCEMSRIYSLFPPMSTTDKLQQTTATLLGIKQVR